MLTYKVLRGNGFNEAHAMVIVTNVIHGKCNGCASYGLRQLLGIVETRRRGKVSPDAEPVVTDAAPIVVEMNAGGVFSLLALERALPLLIGGVRHSDIAALAINRCVHFSTLLADVEPFTEVGPVTLTTTSSYVWVVPVGRMQPPFGIDPIAFGWPCKEKPPSIFDMATSAAARGEIQLHRRVGKAVLEGWRIDDDGQATTDTQAILDNAILTLGEHKGSVLAAMTELLVGPLISDTTSAEPLVWDKRAGGLSYGGELILTLGPICFLEQEAPQYLVCTERLFADM